MNMNKITKWLVSADMTRNQNIKGRAVRFNIKETQVECNLRESDIKCDKHLFSSHECKRTSTILI